MLRIRLLLRHSVNRTLLVLGLILAVLIVLPENAAVGEHVNAAFALAGIIALFLAVSVQRINRRINARL
ncbi:hypothetical protein B5M42_018110 [Paenibacillus athensensis]|uniref:Uncharacterized protein n=1 Tax=Paenibacillus athensensis TaxID=1967502 RepID=A0A4Y8Q2N6_9BACL|nr:hypothetical protein [Paenibacillus athensensis]MCD1260719.1 hypothetical protein [Paenibacillus athensensis]